MIVYQGLFWTGIFLIIYTYILFPVVLRFLAPRKSIQYPLPDPENAPAISVLISAYNEEDVIEKKITSVLDSEYPSGRLEILVGSDASSDHTNEILLSLQKKHPEIKAHLFDVRTGKPEVINRLAKNCSGEILVITDANVMLATDTLAKLASVFSNPQTGLVDTRMVNVKLKKDGISHQEKFYINREVKIKYDESRLWGSMMGPFGGCYAVRAKCFRPVPGHFLVDDFFINMSVLQQGYQCISHIEAEVFEDVSNDLSEEYRRKKRISAGNFQNLARFKSMLLKRPGGVAFCFLSHKVIRWIVPFLALLTLATSIRLGIDHDIYLILALLQILVFLIPLIDFFLRKLKIHTIPLRFISHFVLMNLALMAGFIRFIGGIKNNVWEPTRRNQGEAE